MTPPPDARPRVPLRERNRLRTRELIETVALDLFLRDGFARTTVERIAEDAGIAPRTFFRYFPTKEDVVFPDHDAALRRLRDDLAAAIGPGGAAPLDGLRAAILALQDRDTDGRQVARAQLVQRTPALRERYERLVDDYEAVAGEVLAERLLAAGESPDEALTAALLLCGALFGALRAARRAAGLLTDPDPDALVERVFTLVRRGAEQPVRGPARMR